MSLLDQKIARLRELLTGATAEECIGILTGLLESEEPESAAAACRVAAEAGVDVTAALVALLSSDAYVPLHNAGTSDHVAVSICAMEALTKLNLPVPVEPVLALLRDATKTVRFPEASYDQGAYIGDYGSWLAYPAAFATRIAILAGPAVAADPASLRNMLWLSFVEDYASSKAAWTGLQQMAQAYPEAVRRCVDSAASDPGWKTQKSYWTWDQIRAFLKLNS